MKFAPLLLSLAVFGPWMECSLLVKADDNGNVVKQRRLNGLAVYYDRSAWEAAVNNLFWEARFDEFTQVESFQTSSVDVKDTGGTKVFSLEQKTLQATTHGSNKVDQGTTQWGTWKLVQLYTDYGKVEVELDLVKPVSAWGALFNGITLGQEALRIELDLLGNAGFEAILPTVESGFVGFTLDTGTVEKILFKSTNEAQFGANYMNMDNVVGVTDVTGAAWGDPHFLTWGHEAFDFHGACDLVLIDAPSFGNGLGLTVHIRTKARYEYSYIESAVVQIAGETLQVDSYGSYVLNGVSHADLPATLAGHPIKYTNKEGDANTHVFEIQLGHENDGQVIVLKSFKDMVGVRFAKVTQKDFGDSRGLMGQWNTGARLGRDGKTVLAIDNEFGLEWQVNDSDPKLFVASVGPQYPEKCALPAPPTKEKRRRLGQSIAQQAAEEACSHLVTGKEQCIYDVIATGDLSAAEAGVF